MIDLKYSRWPFTFALPRYCPSNLKKVARKADSKLRRGNSKYFEAFQA